MNSKSYQPSTLTATGVARYFGDDDTVLRQHCLELALSHPNGKDPEDQAKAFLDFIKGVPQKLPLGLVPKSYVDGLAHAFVGDPAFAYSWHANLACAAMDEGLNHEHANRAASRFMKSAFGVETSADMMNKSPEPPDMEAHQTAPEGDAQAPVRRIFRPIRNGENLGDYHALRDLYDIGKVDSLGFSYGVSTAEPTRPNAFGSSVESAPVGKAVSSVGKEDAQPPTATEQGYVIERGNPAYPQYFMFVEDGWNWTAPGDHASALRFARRQDAEQIFCFSASARVNGCIREHSWG